MAYNGLTTNYDDAGYPSSASRTAAVTIGTTQTVKASAGRLVRVVVTTLTATAATTIFDAVGAASGTPLLVIPVGAAVGTVYAVDLPAAAGITVAGAGTGAITIGYS